MSLASEWVQLILLFVFDSRILTSIPYASFTWKRFRNELNTIILTTINKISRLSLWLLQRVNLTVTWIKNPNSWRFDNVNCRQWVLKLRSVMLSQDPYLPAPKQGITIKTKPHSVICYPIKYKYNWLVIRLLKYCTIKGISLIYTTHKH